MITDPLADFLTRIRNAIMMRHEQVVIPHSRLKESVLKILQNEGYIHSFEALGDRAKKMLVVSLKYALDGNPAITSLRKVSKPSRRVYRANKDLTGFRRGLGLRILTTSKGVLSDGEAKKQKVGGEILIEVW